MKKYELTDDTVQIFGKTLRRIKALRDFGDVEAGDLGGYIETESNLSHDGDAWVSGDARVSGNARVYGNAWVSGNACVYGNAWVSSNTDYATVHGFGSCSRATTFFKCKDGLVRCNCGCFYGTLDEFRAKVKETHGDSKFAKEYLAIADVMEMHFREKQK